MSQSSSPADVDSESADPFEPLGNVGAAFVIALALLISIVQCVGVLGVRPLAPGVPGVAMFVAFTAAFVIAFRWLSRRALRGRSLSRRRVVLAAAPAVLLAGYIIAARALPVGRRTEWFLGGDHVRHVIMTAGEQSTGWLTYGAETYPRGWHTLVATVWSAVGLEPSAEITDVLDLTSVLAWGLSVLLTLSTATLAASWSWHRSNDPAAASWAGLSAGSVTLTASFLGNYQGLGLEASVLGAVILAVVVRTQVLDPGAVRSLVVAAAAIVALAHTWQLLLPVVGLAAFRSAIEVTRRGEARPGWVVLLALGSLGAAAPSLWAVVTAIGIDHATDAGVVVPVPWVWLALGVTAGALIAVRAQDHERWAVILALLPGVTGVLLAVAVGITVDTYYPSKLLWHSAALTVPLVAVVVVPRLLGALRRSDRGAPVVRVICTGTAILAMLFVGAQPAAAFFGVWSTADGPTTLRLLQTPSAGSAQLVWSTRGVGTDTITRVLLDAVRPDPGELRTPQRVLSHAEECDILASSPDPTVLSDRSAAEVRREFACVSGVRTIEAR